MMGSVCSNSQPVRVWPASWNATTFLSAGVIVLLFFSIPVCMHVWVVLFGMRLIHYSLVDQTHTHVEHIMDSCHNWCTTYNNNR